MNRFFGGSKAEKVIFCDIGNVLLFFDLFRCINRFLARGKRPASEVLPIVFGTSFVQDLELGKITPLQFYEEACRVFGMKLPFVEFRDLWNDIFTENLPMTRWIKEVSRHYRIYLLSNTNQLHYEGMRRRYDFFRYVHGTFLSNEIGLRKPNPQIFRLALKKTCVPPEQAFYLDDIWGHVYAARRCGMYAEHYVNPWHSRSAWKEFLKNPLT